MKKINKNRGDKLFKKIIYSNKVQKEIRKIRHNFNIPNQGFALGKDIYDWYQKYYFDLKDEFLNEIHLFLCSNILPDNDWWFKKIIEYVLSGGKIIFLPRTYPVDPFVEVTDRVNGRNDCSYINLRIYEGASQRDIIEFIKSNWKFVKPPHRVGTSKIIQPDRDNINEKIMNLMAFVNDRPRGLGINSRNKYSFIGSEIQKELKDKKIYSDNIKMRAYRKRKAKR